MCGITGLAYFDPNRQVNSAKLKQMTDTIIHRGPDDEGFFFFKNVGLGFRRLSIIDLKAGHQPLSNEDESIWIVFNGEIYNFQELRQTLIQKGHVFKTNTDTETIVHLYEEYGVDTAKHLRGMFGFLIFDTKKNRLYGARDRFGIKPFFYYTDQEKFAFGSEIKTILTAGQINKDIDYDALNHYFTYGYISSNLSIYKHIKKLKPGESIEVDLSKNQLTISKYWNIEYHLHSEVKENDLLEQIDDQLSEAVKIHMISDVPIGAFLSGGIDSSSVVGIMSKFSQTPVKTFTIGFKEEKYNETAYARQIADKWKTEHHEYIVEPESIDLLPMLIRNMDEPFADNSILPTYFVSKFAREHVKVVLSGDGGDELFVGYNIYPKFNLIHKYNFPSATLNKMVWGSINSILPDHLFGKGLTNYLSKDRNYTGAYNCMWGKKMRDTLFNREFLEKLTLGDPEEFKVQLIKQSEAKEFTTRMQELDIRTFMVDDVLTKVDRTSMINSLEVRVPLLDHVFAQSIFNIPVKQKFRGNQSKYLFKKAMSKYLTDEILNRPKQGFDVPMGAWFKDDLKEFLGDTFNNKSSRIFDYVNFDYTQKVLKLQDKGMRSFSGKIWSLIVLELWLKDQEKN